MKQLTKLFINFFYFIVVCGCTSAGSRARFTRAEGLLKDGKSEAALIEYKKIIQSRDDKALVKKALVYAAEISVNPLKDYQQSIVYWNDYLSMTSDLDEQQYAKAELANIYFFYLLDYKKAVLLYQDLIKSTQDQREHHEQLYRLARCYFLMGQFDLASKHFNQLYTESMDPLYKEKALYEIGNSIYMDSLQKKEEVGDDPKYFTKALEALRKYIEIYPKGRFLIDVNFLSASVYEELDDDEKAVEAFKKIQTTYPSPLIIESKLKYLNNRILRKKAGTKIEG